MKLRKKEEGEATRQNIRKQIVVVQKVYQKLSDIRENYVNQTINEIVKRKPSYVSIEDLNVRGMMKNKHLSKAIQKQNFHSFRIKLTDKCRLNGIDLRAVDRVYPSSKTCSVHCTECGSKVERDENASINLANAKAYKGAL